MNKKKDEKKGKNNANGPMPNMQGPGYGNDPRSPYYNIYGPGAQNNQSNSYYNGYGRPNQQAAPTATQNNKQNNNSLLNDSDDKKPMKFVMPSDGKCPKKKRKYIKNIRSSTITICVIIL